MIRIITGAPGSGKSYFAVKHLRDTYYKYDKELKEYRKKEGYTIISNLEDLKLEHLSLDAVIKSSGIEIYEFFTVKFQEKITKKYKHLIYVIDECQRFFDERINRQQDTVYFFEYHRHLGIDFYLLTQTYYRLSRKIQGLEENQIHAVNRTSSIMGEFQYNVMSGREIIDKKYLKKDKTIFDLYKSRQKEESEKIRNPLIKYIIFALIILFAGILLFYNTFVSSFTGDESKNKNPEIKKSTLINSQNIQKKEIIKIKKKKEENKIPYPVSFVSVDNEIKIYDRALKIMIPIEFLKEDFIIQKNNNQVIRVYKYITYAHARELRMLKKQEAASLDIESDSLRTEPEDVPI